MLALLVLFAFGVVCELLYFFFGIVLSSLAVIFLFFNLSCRVGFSYLLSIFQELSNVRHIAGIVVYIWNSSMHPDPPSLLLGVIPQNGRSNLSVHILPLFSFASSPCAHAPVHSPRSGPLLYYLSVRELLLSCVPCTPLKAPRPHVTTPS